MSPDEHCQQTSRFVTSLLKIRDEKKIYGTHRLDPSTRVYVTEGQFDSLFLPNAVASGDANLIGLADYLKKEFGCQDVVLVYDNTPRNKEIVEQMEKAIEEGHQVVILPYDPHSKDINEMVKFGYNELYVKCLVEKYTFSGLTARLQLNQWRKC